MMRRLGLWWKFACAVTALGSGLVWLACTSFDSSDPTSTPEAGPPADAPAETTADAFAADADAGVQRFCATVDAAFRCFDFDEPDAAVDFGWNGTTGSVQKIAEFTSSPPFAMLAEVPAASTVYAKTTVTEVPFVKRLTIELDFYPLAMGDTLGQLFQFEVKGLALYLYGSSASLYLQEFANDGGLDAAGPIGATPPAPPLTANKWSHVRFDFELSAKTAIYAVDGTPHSLTLKGAWAPAEGKIGIGIGYVVPGQEHRHVYDNVVIRVN